METPTDASPSVAYESGNGTATPVQLEDEYNDAGEPETDASLTHSATQATLDNYVADLASLSPEQLQEVITHLLPYPTGPLQSQYGMFSSWTPQLPNLGPTNQKGRFRSLIIPDHTS